MRLAFLSDIHGNLEALKRVLADVTEQGVDGIISLGDIVGYAPQGQECLDLIQESAMLSCLGNHDAGVLNFEEFEGVSSDVAIEALELSLARINQRGIAYLQSLPLKIEFKEFDISVAHCTIRKNSLVERVADDSQIREEWLALKTGIGVIGHTHIPLIYNGIMFRREWCQKKIITKNQKLFLNPGSVGKPRDGDQRAAYAILDIKKSEIVSRIRRVPYDIEITRNRIKAANFPDSLWRKLELAT